MSRISTAKGEDIQGSINDMSKGKVLDSIIKSRFEV